MVGSIGWRGLGALAVLGCGAVAAVLLPPNTLGLPEERAGLRPDQERQALARDIGQLQGLIERELIEETLDETALQIRFLAPGIPGSRESGVEVVRSPEVQELTRRVRALLDEAGAVHGVTDPAGRMALVYAPNDLLGRVSGPPTGGRGGGGTWTADSGHGTVCSVRIPSSSPEGLRERAAAGGDWTLLGSTDACLLNYWFGPPGPAVGSWYQGRGRAFARMLPGTRPWGAWPRLERGVFGKRTRWGLMDDLTLDRCRTGELQVCEEGWLGVPQNVDSQREVSSGLAYDGNRFSNPFRGWGDGLLFELLKEMGPDRFRAFWASDRPVGEAFRQAFGTEPGAWVQGRLIAAVGPGQGGPAPGGTEAAAVLTLVLGCGIWGGFRGRRRRTAHPQRG